MSSNLFSVFNAEPQPSVDMNANDITNKLYEWNIAVTIPNPLSSVQTCSDFQTMTDRMESFIPNHTTQSHCIDKTLILQMGYACFFIAHKYKQMKNGSKARIYAQRALCAFFAVNGPTNGNGNATTADNSDLEMDNSCIDCVIEIKRDAQPQSLCHTIVQTCLLAAEVEQTDNQFNTAHNYINDALNIAAHYRRFADRIMCSHFLSDNFSKQLYYNNTQLQPMNDGIDPSSFGAISNNGSDSSNRDDSFSFSSQSALGSPSRSEQEQDNVLVGVDCIAPSPAFSDQESNHLSGLSITPISSFIHDNGNHMSTLNLIPPNAAFFPDNEGFAADLFATGAMVAAPIATVSVPATVTTTARLSNANDKPYKCDICGRGYATKSGIHNHKKSHSAPKFKCDLCGKSYIHRHQLNKHFKNTHLGMKPFKCDICNAAFAKKYNLTRHYRIHTGERPFKCTFCELAFIDSTSLVDHKRRKHSQNHSSNHSQ